MDWKNYQEKTAEFFRSIGLEADTNVTIKGIRTKHDIDVLVKSNYVGFDITWIVECKYWNSRVSKLHVLALREIVNDTGADRGILITENGFQSGAKEASILTNVELTSLECLKKSASNNFYAMKLQDLSIRLLSCKEKYWEIPKKTRIEVGLRPDYHGYSGDWVIQVCEDIANRAFSRQFPLTPDKNHIVIAKSGILIGKKIPEEFANIIEVVAFMENLVSNLETKIEMCS